MKMSARNLIIGGVIVLMVAVIGVGLIQTRQSSTPPSTMPGPMDGLSSMGSANMGNVEIPVVVDVDYESAVLPLTVATLPKEILALDLAQVTQGSEALEAINTLHGKGITVSDGIVARYGQKGNSLEFWFSTSPSVEEASQLLSQMIEKMKTNDIYSTPMPMPIRKRLYYQTIGNGLMHFFYQRGSQLVWVTLDLPQEQMMTAMKEIIEL